MKPEKITFEIWVDGVREYSALDAEDALSRAEKRAKSKRGRTPGQVTVYECDDNLGVKLLGNWINGERKQ